MKNEFESDVWAEYARIMTKHAQAEEAIPAPAVPVQSAEKVVYEDEYYKAVKKEVPESTSGPKLGSMCITVTAKTPHGQGSKISGWIVGHMYEHGWLDESGNYIVPGSEAWNILSELKDKFKE